MRSDDYLDEDVDERDRRSASAIFASGWFRAVLVLGVLAITLVVAVPYVLRWMEPSSARIERQVARPVDLRPSAPTAQPAPIAAPTPVSAPVAPAASSPASSVPVVSAPVPLPLPSATASSSPTPSAAAPRPMPSSAPTGVPVIPAPPPKMAATPTTERLVPAPAPVVSERDTSPPKSTAADADPGKTERAARKAAHPETAPARVSAPPAARGGDFWVQVGAFQRERNAEALVRSIRDEMKMPAQMTRRVRAETVGAAPARHEVFVTDAPVGAVNAALRGHGSAQAVRGGVAVQPPLELKEAVALSRRLSGEGLSVKIRRVGGEAAAAEPATTYVVRVGGYGTRAQAEAARRELARKGVPGFLPDTPAK